MYKVQQGITCVISENLKKACEYEPSWEMKMNINKI
jgi:hypothetical protein